MALLLIAGVSAFYLTRLLRVLAPAWLKDRKPLGCNTCSSFWLALSVIAAHVSYPWERFWLVLPSAGISLLLLELYESLVPKDPTLGGLNG